MGAQQPGELYSVEGDPHELGDHYKLVLDLARAVVEAQRASAEKQRSFAQATFVVVAGMFTIAQTAAFTGFGMERLATGEQSAILLAGVGAAVALCVTGYFAMKAHGLRPVDAISVADIVNAADRAVEADEHAAAEILPLLASAEKKQAEMIRVRRGRLADLQKAALATLGLTLLEVVIALLARIP